jgi:hypothetical protein
MALRESDTAACAVTQQSLIEASSRKTLTTHKHTCQATQQPKHHLQTAWAPKFNNLQRLAQHSCRPAVANENNNGGSTHARLTMPCSTCWDQHLIQRSCVGLAAQPPQPLTLRHEALTSSRPGYLTTGYLTTLSALLCMQVV